MNNNNPSSSWKSLPHEVVDALLTDLDNTVALTEEYLVAGNSTRTNAQNQTTKDENK